MQFSATLLHVVSLTVSLAASSGSIIRSSAEPTCGYESCPKTKPAVVNVHLVPHTHDDVGWLKTVDQYYYGSQTSTQRAGVQYILDSVVQALARNKERKFVYVETAFFWRWWRQQDQETQTLVKRLVNSGQLEFIGGAWSMNDEACTHYNSLVDQFTWGFKRLKDIFGKCAIPKVGWQLDPFGHSREQASLMAQMGFDGTFFGRIDSTDRTRRWWSQEMELVWKASNSLGKESWLFTGILFTHYSAPSGFCYDVMCSDTPIMDDPDLHDYNVDERVAEFVRQATNQNYFYSNNHIMLTMGDDFHYQDAGMYFKNLDKLIRHVNNQSSELYVFYSTPSCYLKSLNGLSRNWTTKTDDFFPYGSDDHSFWTGYFTSRPTQKEMERKGNNLLQISKQLHVLAGLHSEETTEFLTTLREEMGVMQHHDAITGTEKQHVADDYALRMDIAMKNGHKVVESAIGKITNSDEEPSTVSYSTPCNSLNTSTCSVTEEHDKFIITVYNPVARKNLHYVRVPVQNKLFIVRNSEGEEIENDIVPLSAAVRGLPGRISSATHELLFPAEDIPPLGYLSFYVTSSPKPAHSQNEGRIRQNGIISKSKWRRPSMSEFYDMISKNKIPQSKVFEDDLVLKMGATKLSLNQRTGMISEMKMRNSKTIKFSQDFAYYNSKVGNNADASSRASGAYVFRPDSDTPTSFNVSSIKGTFDGIHVQEVHQEFSDWVKQTIRIYKKENYAEFDWIVGPIPTSGAGKEVITRYKINETTNGIFFTDSNGREVLKRVRDGRETFDITLKEIASGNYYPINSRISVAGERTGISILTDRSVGGSSLHDGEIEIMIHRRCLHDDAFGVGEALNEQEYGQGLVVRGRHRVFITSDSSNKTEERLEAQRFFMSPWILPATTTLSFDDWQKRKNNNFSGMKSELPPNIHLLTLEPWGENSILLRLEHQFQKSDEPTLGLPVSVNLKELFATFAITSIQETILGGNQNIEDVHRMNWNTGNESDKINGEGSFNPRVKNSFNEGDYTVFLEPMQIRTFIVNVEYNWNNTL